MAVIRVTEETFAEEVLNTEKTVIADFNADWCGPCRMLAPMLEKVSDEHPEAKFVSVNIDENEELADVYDISSIPCLVVFKGGQEYKRSVGLIPSDAIAALLRD